MTLGIILYIIYHISYIIYQVVLGCFGLFFQPKTTDNNPLGCFCHFDSDGVTVMSSRMYVPKSNAYPIGCVT